MKILITGASGMVGHHLIKLLSHNKNIHLLRPTRADLDLLDQARVEQYMHTHKPDFVFHLAARVGGIQANLKNPVEFLSDNLLISTYVIMAARAAGIPKLVNLGSSCMYPKNRELLKEDDLLSGQLEPTNEGYALAKISSVRLCQYIRKQDSLEYKTLVPCNLYGEYDHFAPERSHLIPAVLYKLHIAKQRGNNEVTIWGDGEARREFMYAGDLADFMMLTLSSLGKLPEIINVGLGYDYSVNEYYRVGAEVVGYRGSFSRDLEKPSGMKKKLMDVSKAREFGWHAKTSLQDGMRKAYEYFLSHEELSIGRR